ncbi:MAG: DUF3616 domain-containing protein, partial [Gemmatimonadetes bacterium]|nr:DUF3616 domain-containing protein [Gemmatimonadota bacterium]
TELLRDVAGGADHPEGMCRFDEGGAPHSLLVVYDGASRDRGGRGVTGDVFAVDRPTGLLGQLAERLGVIGGDAGEA